MHKILVAAILAAGLSGCAAPTPSALANNDPYETTNRAVFALNQKIDRLALRPTAETYKANVPAGARDAIHNALQNLNAPVTFANDLLQAQPRRAGQTVARFVLNSSFGVAGLFDVADSVGIPPHSEDFGQTLAVWGVGEGPYLVLPLLGPDPPRDAAGQVVDFALDPTIYIRIKQHLWWQLGRHYVTIVEARARNMETLDDIERDSLDFYAATRSLYRQYRDNEIRNGESAAPPVSN